MLLQKLNIMKNLIFSLFIIHFSFSQSPIIPLNNFNGNINNNDYLKDTNNNLDTFIGTYLHNENGVYFLIKLRKEIKYFNGFYYIDRLIGDLEYKENNITLLNTVQNFNSVFNFHGPNFHSIKSDYLLNKNEKPECVDCQQNELQLSATIFDTRKYSSFILKKTNINGQEALKVLKYTVGPYSKIDGQAPIENIIADKEYIFIKQP
jgi:hypothetical protein